MRKIRLKNTFRYLQGGRLLLLVAGLLFAKHLAWGQVSVGNNFSSAVLSFYILFFVIPGGWLVLRTIFPKMITKFISLTLLFVLLFPHWIFFFTRDETRIFAWPDNRTFGFFPAWSAFCFILVLGVIVALYFIGYKKYKIYWRKKIILILGLAVLLTVIQLWPRLGIKSPKCLKFSHEDIKNGRSPTFRGKPFKEFFGYHYCGYDVYQHTELSGIFRGIDSSRYRSYCMNRRGLGAFLYSLIVPFFNPYLAAIGFNGFLYLLMLLSGYILARLLRMDDSFAVAYMLLLSANYYLLFQALQPYFYFTYNVLFMFILTAGIKWKIFDKPGSLRRNFLFGLLVGCGGLAYDAFVFSSFILFWAAGVVLRDFKKNKTFCSIKILCRGIGLALFPLFAQIGWELLLAVYGLTGSPKNTNIRQAFFDRSLEFQNFLVANIKIFPDVILQYSLKILVTNPMSSAIEHWPWLGFLGPIGILVIMPFFFSCSGRTGMWAMYASNLSIGILSGIIASIPPIFFYAYLLSSPERTNNAYPVLILGQTLVVYFLVRYLVKLVHLKETIGGWLTCLVAGVVWLFSFWPLRIFWHLSKN